MNKNNLKLKIEHAKAYEDVENYFSAAIYYKEGLEMAIKVEDSKAIKLCKAKVVEMNKKAIASGKDFKEVEIPFELSDKDQNGIKAFISNILEITDMNKILEEIGKHSEFRPNLKTIEEQAKTNMPIAHQLATLTTVSDSGHNVRGGSIGVYSWFMQMYDINQKLISEFLLSKVMYMLINNESTERRLTFTDMKSYFSNSKLFSPENLEVILVGLDRYFAKDYVSALHILVSQFEALLLSIAQGCGINIVVLDKTKDIATRTLTLSEVHLDSEDFKKVFGEDFCRQIKFVMFEPMGYKLRHKIAHGEIRISECNFQNTTLILYLYLVILARVTK